MQTTVPAISALLRGSIPDTTARQAIDPQSLPMYTLVVSSGLLLALAIAGTDFQYDHRALNGALLSLVTLCACGLGLRRYGYPAVGAALEITTLMLAVSAGAACATLLVAATAVPYADHLLIKPDAAIFFGFNWCAMLAVLKPYDEILSLASRIYATLTWQPTLLVVTLLALKRNRVCWVFATAWSISLAFTVAVFPFLPALGGFLHFGVTPADVPSVLVPAAWRQGELLEPVRDGTLRLITVGTFEGVVSFPSFHAAGAVLLGWGFSHVRWLSIPFIALNLAMFIAAIPIGGHYLVDVAAGGLLAILSIMLASGVVRRVDAA